MRNLVLSAVLMCGSCAALLTAFEVVQAFEPAVRETLRAIVEQWGDSPDVTKAVAKVNTAVEALKGVADAGTATDDKAFTSAVANVRSALESLFELTIPMGLHPLEPRPGEARAGVIRASPDGLSVPTVDALMVDLENTR